MKPVLETTNLTKYYGSFLGVERINLSIDEGEIFGFLGPNGAGKTTTVRLLLDLIRPPSGSYRILGYEGSGQHLKIREHMGNLPGEIGFYLNMTGQEFLERFGQNQSTLAKKIKRYSKGMKQKLGLIQAMQHDPDLLILDEPSEGLNPLMQHELYEILLSLKQRGRTVFFSSHILSEVEKICDRVAIIREGEIQAIENIQTLKQKMIRRLTVSASMDTLERIAKIEQLELDVRRGSTAVYRFSGEISILLRELSQFEIHDLIFPEPELEDVFLAYYK